MLHLEAVRDTTMHNAFTSICQWRDTWWLAHRVARTHNIVPPGHIQLRHTLDVAQNQWHARRALTHPSGDLRDPKLIPTDEALWLMAGLYVPHPVRETGLTGLSPRSHENLLHTVLCYTTDGSLWSDWVPILRPQYWGWSVVPIKDGWLCVAYHCGQPGEGQSLVLWVGASLLKLAPIGTIYEGISQEREGREVGAVYRYPSLLPNEAVLYQPTPTTLGCLVRTEKQMDVGVSRLRGTLLDWRWTPLRLDEDPSMHTVSADILHPSGVLQTPHGWLLAARQCHPVYATSMANDRVTVLTPQSVDHYTTSTRLFHLHGQYAEFLLTLPGGRDCGYSELCAGPEPDTYLMSYYAQQPTVSPLPSAAIYVATIRVTA